MNFEDLGLGPEILKAVEERGYTTPTPIQAQAIPHILMMRDVLGLAQTGTGKTASFTLPMIEILSGGRARARMPRSLILSPTRELAAQIADNFDVYGKYHKLTKALLVGGESMGDQIKLLDRGVDVLIATPGRLLDLFERGNILLNDIKVLVIDEADRMLDMGFIPDIEKIVSKVPPMRQTLLFSATMPPEIRGLAEKFLSNPKQVSVAAAASPAMTVKQSLLWVSQRNKQEALESLIKSEDVKNAFVFCNRKKDVDILAKALSARKYSAAGMHGDMTQTVRTRTLQEFKDGTITLLICSDVAARGIDIAGVSHVFNYDVPMHPDDYVHRIGRTGRAGMQGRAWTLATSDDDKYVKAIESLIKKEIPVETIDGLKTPVREDAREDSAGGERNNRNRSRSSARPERSEPQGQRSEPQGQRSEPQRHRSEQPKQRNDQPKPERRDEKSTPQNAPRAAKPRQQDDSNGGGFSDDDLPAFLRR